MYLAAIDIFTSSESEAVEVVGLELVTLSLLKRLGYRDECRAVPASPLHNHFMWMSPKYTTVVS